MDDIGIARLRLTMVGSSPLIMHNKRLGDPMDSFAKAIADITKKSKKTDTDRQEIERLEWYGGLYTNPPIEASFVKAGVKNTGTLPYIPADNMRTCLVDAAKLTKQGGALEKVLSIVPGSERFAYSGPEDLHDAWEDAGMRCRANVKVQSSRLMRMRPQFPEWGASFDFMLVTGVKISVDDVRDIATMAGLVIGLADWRDGGRGRFSCNLEVIS